MTKCLRLSNVSRPVALADTQYSGLRNTIYYEEIFTETVASNFLISQIEKIRI